MAEYITIMLINNKTAGAFNNLFEFQVFCADNWPLEQITAELEDGMYFNGIETSRILKLHHKVLGSGDYGEST